ncbi:methylenetetrahydrofolate reductase [Amycolatopsis rhabdoformis]|uniref:Methylenetetrahydrofolate reductase n=1 Tax=Amycolatopsis rhabdoformis TaxID=1448059 RepID=A0ABZ1I667_9PSEU|nr:methylenetetrahydrofolate reductase [Amycolatopsis rhabdoformis]WSE29924.1 methylenetetrahydrofolate reductase [Amycolatopsis rhabdoformis]
MSPRETVGVTAEIRSLVRDAKIEIIPIKGYEAKFAEVPKSTTVTITCSPKFGLERTLAATEYAAAQGFTVVPHLAARQVADETELKEFVRRLEAAAVTGLYVIAGDAAEPAGIFTSSAELLDSLAGFDHGLTSIGVACYPEGHPAIPDDVLAEALRTKQSMAHYMVSQLCFDPKTLTRWLRATREAGITLPLHIGLAASMQTRKLAELSLKIGVGSSLRYLAKQHGLVGNLLRGKAYRPEQMLAELGTALTEPEMNVERLHMFSFNQVGATAQWQQHVTDLHA